MRAGLWIVVLVAAVLLIGCGGGSEKSDTTAAEAPKSSGATAALAAETERDLRTVRVAVDGWDRAERVGMDMAETRGYFADAGLRLHTFEPKASRSSIDDVLDGRAEIAVAHSPEVVAARDKGRPIVVVGSLVSHATEALVWTEGSGVGGLSELERRSVAIPGLMVHKSFLLFVITKGGLSLPALRIKGVGGDLVPALVRGKADATFGGSGISQKAGLEARGIQSVVIPLRNFGFPDYEELVLVARRDEAEADPQLMHGFAKAAARGAAAAFEDPEGAVEALESSGEIEPGATPESTAAEVQELLPLLSRGGNVNHERMQHLINWMELNEMLRNPYPVKALLASP